jgi:hypothetical protein
MHLLKKSLHCAESPVSADETISQLSVMHFGLHQTITQLSVMNFGSLTRIAGSAPNLI